AFKSHSLRRALVFDPTSLLFVLTTASRVIFQHQRVHRGLGEEVIPDVVAGDPMFLSELEKLRGRPEARSATRDGHSDIEAGLHVTGAALTMPNEAQRFEAVARLDEHVILHRRFGEVTLPDRSIDAARRIGASSCAQ